MQTPEMTCYGDSNVLGLPEDILAPSLSWTDDDAELLLNLLTCRRLSSSYEEPRDFTLIYNAN